MKSISNINVFPLYKSFESEDEYKNFLQTYCKGREETKVIVLNINKEITSISYCKKHYKRPSVSILSIVELTKDEVLRISGIDIGAIESYAAYDIIPGTETESPRRADNPCSWSYYVYEL